MQLRPEAAIIFQFLRCLGNVASWNIRPYRDQRHITVYSTYGSTPPGIYAFKTLRAQSQGLSLPKS